MKPEISYTTNPEISFVGKSFCFIGVFNNHSRSELERFVKSRGATFTPNVSEATDYLVIGGIRIRCCSFSCCVRVVEKALALMEGGAPLEFIQEHDFIRIMPAGTSNADQT